MKTIWVEDVDEEEVSVYPGRVYRLSAHVSQTMFTENSTTCDKMLSLLHIEKDEKRLCM